MAKSRTGLTIMVMVSVSERTHGWYESGLEVRYRKVPGDTVYV